MSEHPLVVEARTLLGVPFRLHGRDPQRGLDCAGLLLTALHRTGHLTRAECEQFSRTPSAEAAIAFLKSRATVCQVNEIETGDVVLGLGRGTRAAVGVISQLAPRKLIHVTTLGGVIEQDLPSAADFLIAHVFRF